MTPDARGPRPDDAEELREAEAWLLRQASLLPPVPASEDVRRKREILSAIHQRGARRSSLAALIAWLREPREVRLSPLGVGGLALAVATIGLVLGFTWSRRVEVGANFEVRESPIGGARESVRFTLEAPNARQVVLVGDFNDWDPTATPLSRSGREAWIVDLPLEPGLYHYSFVVDGRLRSGSGGPLESSDGLGGRNSVVIVQGVAL
ncbi:MAG: isoamylase early set domain-containing protein [Candidatus Eisenbacteria bacterium]